MFKHQQVIIVDDENFQLLAVLVFAILLVSLLMNGLLTTFPVSVTGPPVRINGYFGPDGRPAPGYYTTVPVEIHPAEQSAVQTPPEAPPVP